MSDRRVFGGKRGTRFIWILCGIEVDSVAPHRVSEQHIGAFGPCAITFSVKLSCVEREILSDIFMYFALYAWTG